MSTIASPLPKTIVRLENLLRRALDPAAPTPEAETSAVMAVRFARRADIDFAGLVAAIAPSHRLPAPEPLEPPACEIVMPHGRHAGETLGDIARDDLSYLRWAGAEWRDPDLRDAAQTVLDYFAGRAE